jgi:hypothetical protein
VEPSGASKPGEGSKQGLGASIEAAIKSTHKAAAAVIHDIRSIEQMLPNWSEVKGLPLIAIPDEVFDLPRKAADDAKRSADELMREIERMVPTDALDILIRRRPFQNQVERLRDVRLLRAAASIHFRRDATLMQVETLRLMQDVADEAYTEATSMLKRGALEVHLSTALTIGNYVDAKVRKVLRARYAALDIREGPGKAIRVNRVELEAASDERMFRRPDARVGDVAFDVTMTPKTGATPQVRGFFRSETRPRMVIIVRPHQISNGGSYIITRAEIGK